MIEIKKVSKRFDKIAAVSDVSLSINRDRFLVSLERMVQERVHFFE